METLAVQTEAKATTAQTGAKAVITAGTAVHTVLHVAAELVKLGTASLACQIDKQLDKETVKADIQAKSELRYASLEDRLAGLRAKRS